MKGYRAVLTATIVGASNLNLTSVIKEISKYSSVTIDFLAKGGDPTKAAGLATIERKLDMPSQACWAYVISSFFKTIIIERLS